MVDIAAIILSAGLSQRMGEENKLFLPLDGRPMVEWVITSLYYSNASYLRLVSSDLSHEQLIPYQNSRTKIVENPRYQLGMTTSIQAGVMASPDVQGFMICLGDQPFITQNVYNEIINAFQRAYRYDPKAILIPLHQGKKGNPVIFSHHYREAILSHQEMNGCKELIISNKEHVVEVAIDTSDILVDIDTPEDYQKFDS